MSANLGIKRDAQSGRDALQHMQSEAVKTNGTKANSLIPNAPAKLLDGKKCLVVGIANEHSIAWGCAKAFRALGADVAVTYVNEKAKKFVAPLAESL
jgi:enoyl-[acyl-carrier protein] reductase I